MFMSLELQEASTVLDLATTCSIQSLEGANSDSNSSSHSPSLLDTYCMPALVSSCVWLFNP